MRCPILWARRRFFFFALIASSLFFARTRALSASAKCASSPATCSKRSVKSTLESSYPDGILGRYFDVAVGDDWVSGRLNPRRNRGFRASPLTDYEFVLTNDGGGTFDVINQRDSAGRLFGAIQVKAAVGSVGESHALAASLRRISDGQVLSDLTFTVNVVAKTVLQTMKERIFEYVFQEDHLRQ